MLVLTRELGGRIILHTAAGEVIEIQLLETRGAQARIGIHAPKSVIIAREEIDEALVAKRREMAG